MNEFDYIPQNGKYKEIVDDCILLTKLVEPSEIALHSRDILLKVLKEIYNSFDKAYPVNATMIEIIDSPIVKSFVNNREILEAIHFARKLGKDAEHGEAIKKNSAMLSRDNVLFFMKYAVSKIEKIENIDEIVLPKYMSEEQTRKIYIDTYLKEAGWNVLEPKNTTVLPGGMKRKSGDIVPGNACCEIPVKGMNRVTGMGFCDYVLYDTNGDVLAIVEAKKTSEDITMGVKQVKEYGDCMKSMPNCGYVPILYYTNGYEIYVIDGLYAARQVMGFHSKEELRYMLQRRNRKHIDSNKYNSSIAGRPYQIEAVTTVCERFNAKYLRNLIVMATGTGKTRVSIALVKLLLDNNWIKNVLFLADRTSLVEQAFKNFKRILPEMSYQVLSNRKLANETNARIVFSTHQTMINYIDAEEKEYTIGRFDLIIIDEAHRSIFNKYGSIFNYFDSLLVGLTATPRNQVDADTYKMFGCEPGEPHFEYKLESAVQDKYLVPYKLESRTTKLLSTGIKYKDLSEKDKEKVDSLLVEDEQFEEEDVISKEHLFRRIYNRSTCARVLEDLMNNGIRVEDGQLIGKTIIFAYNHKHAELIVNVFKEIYPIYGEDYCQLIDNRVKDADQLIVDFEEKKNFRIAVSVDMLDTGIDVPAVLNLVFFKPVKSQIKFVQMIGRGTRLCPGLLDGKDKTHFLIFDYLSNFEFFDENPVGTENVNGKTLSQKLFDVKLNILVELQNYERQTDPICKAYYDKLKPELYNKIAVIKRCQNRISVREELPYVDKYVDYNRWSVIAPLAKKEILLHLSKLVDADLGEDNEVLRFDMIMLQVELAVLAKGNIQMVSKEVESVRTIAKTLLSYAAGEPAVLKKADSLKELVGTNFWLQPTMDKLEQYREEVRTLLIYLPEKVKPVDVDTPDHIEVKDYTGTGLIDIRTYREKVMDYLAENVDNMTIRKIQNLEQIDSKDIKELERILWEELGTAEEYHKATSIENLAVFIRSIVGVEQEAINEKFGDFLNTNVLNSTQMEFVRAIINYVRVNGDINPEDLIEKAPFDSYSLIDLFGENVGYVTRIIKVVHESVMVA